MIACAVDIGGTSTKLGIVDDNGAVHHFRSFPTAPPSTQYLAQLDREVGALLDTQTSISGVGVSVAGFIDPAHSAMIYNPNILWLENVPLRFASAEAARIPVQVEVDSNAAALGEFRFGEGHSSKRFLLLTIGTGIGGGFIVDGNLVRFTHECIGDVGHVVVNPNGRLCTCGGVGCAEAEASAPAILEKAGAASLTDPACAPVLVEAGRQIGMLAASLAAIFFPDSIALGGGVSQASDDLLEAAQQSFKRTAGTALRDGTRIVRAKLGAHASLVGAACPFLSR